MTLKFLTWLKLSLVVLVAGGFVAMILYALLMRESIRTAQIEPPLITAPETPVKKRPDEAGGREFADQDKLVFDLLESPTAAQSPEIVGALPKPPLSSPTDVSPLAVLAPVSASQTAAQASANLPEEVVAAPAQVAQVQEAKPERKPETQSAAAKPEAKPENVAAPKTWRVQLAAVPSRAAGETMAAQMQAKFAALKPLAPHFEPTGKGGFVRVQFAGLKSRAEAAAVCAKLAGQACFPVAPK